MQTERFVSDYNPDLSLGCAVGRYAEMSTLAIRLAVWRSSLTGGAVTVAVAGAVGIDEGAEEAGAVWELASRWYSCGANVRNSRRWMATRREFIAPDITIIPEMMEHRRMTNVAR